MPRTVRRSAVKAAPQARSRSDVSLTVRIPEADGTLDRLTALGLLDDTTIADQMRTALDLYIKRRINDPDLPLQMEAAESRHRARVAALTDPAAAPPSPRHESRIAGRAVGLRISQDVLDKVTALALIDDSPNVASQIRVAISEYIDGRLQDGDLEERIQDASSRHLEVLSTLGRAHVG